MTENTLDSLITRTHPPDLPEFCKTRLEQRYAVRRITSCRKREIGKQRTQWSNEHVLQSTRRGVSLIQIDSNQAREFRG